MFVYIRNLTGQGRVCLPRNRK